MSAPAPRRPGGDRLLAPLLALFPREFRDRFGDDMRAVFTDQLRAARARGAPAVARLWLRTVPALARAALLEHGDAWRERRARTLASPPSHDTLAARSHAMLENLRSDLRLAGRVLRKSPAFTAVAAFVIALGSGAVTTIFSAMNALVLRPLPGAADPARLVRVERVRQDGTGGHTSVSYPYYEHLRDNARALSPVAWSKVALTVTAGGEGAAVYGNLVSGNFFAVLGVRPALGRFFAPDEGTTEMAHPVIVVSEGFWRTRLGADSGAVGRTVAVNGRPYVLLGVAPAAFTGLDAPIKTDAWVPLAMKPHLRPESPLGDPSTSWLRLAGRLTDGATPDGARTELRTLTAARAAAGVEPPEMRAFDDLRLSKLTGLPSDATSAVGGFLALLLGAASLVLLIASVNVASMLSARAVARRREMAVRAALGAARGRLVRQLLTEILALFALGAGGGVALTALATTAFERMPIPGLAGSFSVALELSPDARVLAFALLVSLAAGVAFGLAPALQGVRRDITARLRADSAAASPRRVISNGLVVGQLALSLLLLVAAGLFLRALDRGQRVDPGFDPGQVAVASFNADAWGYDEATARAFYRALRDELAAAPGVTAAAYAERLPLTMNSSGDDIQVDGAATRGEAGGGAMPVRMQLVGEDYFAAIRLPLVAGRAFRRADDERAPPVAVVNETLARRLAAGGGALGRTFGYRGQRVTIVGVARDAKYADLAEATPPMVYLPLDQQWRPARTLLVRTAGSPVRIAPAVRRAVRALDPALPRPTVTTLAQETAIVLLPQRVAAVVTGALGGAGLLLASVGLYGVVAYSVSRRTREIGIRVAIGARRTDVLRMVLREGMRLTALGVAGGVALAAVATRLMASLLFGVSPLDPVTFAAMSGLFVTVALVATWLPARRAAAADPRVALQAE